MFNTPILLLLFNRPEPTAKVFEKIREIKPQKLYIGADGPRRQREGERELCELTRKIVVEKVDWPCELKTLFRKENLGSGQAVSEAITWFFEDVEQGIILEDDCLPDISFFHFCEALLDKYATDQRVMSVSGTNLLPEGWHAGNQSYFFGHGGIWGWATWRRAWKLFDFGMSTWFDEGNPDKIRKAMNSDDWFYYYLGMFRNASRNNHDVWDLQWFHCILNNGALAINPSVNLVKNIGFGPDATHTMDLNSAYAKLEMNSMPFPLVHPKKVMLDKKFLRAIYNRIAYSGKTPVRVLKQRARLFLTKLRKEYTA